MCAGIFSRILYTDDDEYWKNGTTYNYPNDRSIMGAKRMGIATTINIGTKKGKSILRPLCICCSAVDWNVWKPNFFRRS
ncbi:DUF5808 domain-containing protein [Paenibacillus odorifer]|uniref:DUF5808 domain-containing protein n=1 Tax=Paenibacillus TaxID=44249 RepID=UPI0034CE0D1D